jgi:uncharacterized protein YdeI (YjbR/CyaY-like superfamily)
MPVRKTLRAGAGVRPGDTVSVVLERDQAERSVAVPPVLKKELRNRKIARASWEKLSFTHKKEIALALTGAKQEQTRARRLAKVLDVLSRGKKWTG